MDRPGCLSLLTPLRVWDTARVSLWISSYRRESIRKGLKQEHGQGMEFPRDGRFLTSTCKNISKIMFMAKERISS